jgi:hypothetical protein
MCGFEADEVVTGARMQQDHLAREAAAKITFAYTINKLLCLMDHKI